MWKSFHVSTRSEFVFININALTIDA